MGNYYYPNDRLEMLGNIFIGLNFFNLLPFMPFEALIASASAPAAAPPVYIDNVMYVDGGVRFGLFRAAEDNVVSAAQTLRQRPLAFRIVNGTLETDAQCPFEAAAGAPCPVAGTLRKWDFADIAQRSVKLLTNQVYRFSVAAASQPGDPPVALIRADAGAHPLTLGGETLSCDAWRARDNAAKPPPVEFHPLQMRCLIDYGRTRMDGLEWWLLR